MPDPRLNCAAEICCPPPAARDAKGSLVRELLSSLSDNTGKESMINSCSLEDAENSIVEMMAKLDIEFAPGELMRAIRDLADHPNRN